MTREISAPLARTARLLDLVPFLNTHQGIALKELAQHFAVSTQQMSADLTTLWMCGLPGYSPLELMDLEFESGYVTISNAETLSKPRTITFQEGVALLLGLDLIATSIPEERQDLLSAVASLSDKLTKLLGAPIKLSVVTATSSTVTEAISKALQENMGLRIRYHSIYNDRLSQRVIAPLDIYDSNNHQYLRAYCFTARDYREFRIDRIESAESEAIPQPLESPKSSSDKIDFSVTIKSPSRDVAERFAIFDFSLGARAQLSSYSRQWIQRSVMASGNAVILETPSEIRSEISQKAQLLLDRYKAE
jgi:proteasome accessory factor C